MVEDPKRTQEREQEEKLAHTLHYQGEQARERGDAAGAVTLHTASLEKYTATNNILKQVELHACLCLDYRRLATEAQSEETREQYRALAKSDVDIAVGLAEELAQTGNTSALALAHEHRGKYYVWNHEYAKAVVDFTAALEAAPTPGHTLIYERHYVQLQLHLAELFAGKVSSDEAILATIQQLINDVPKFYVPPVDGFDEVYNVKVWISGAYMQLAQFFKETDPTKTKRHLSDAKDITQNDGRLIVRGQDYDRLAASFA